MEFDVIIESKFFDRSFIIFVIQRDVTRSLKTKWKRTLLLLVQAMPTKTKLSYFFVYFTINQVHNCAYFIVPEEGQFSLRWHTEKWLDYDFGLRH
jgi:hypothetical protein